MCPRAAAPLRTCHSGDVLISMSTFHLHSGQILTFHVHAPFSQLNAPQFMFFVRFLLRILSALTSHSNARREADTSVKSFVSTFDCAKPFSSFQSCATKESNQSEAQKSYDISANIENTKDKYAITKQGKGSD